MNTNKTPAQIAMENMINEANLTAYATDLANDQLVKLWSAEKTIKEEGAKLQRDLDYVAYQLKEGYHVLGTRHSTSALEVAIDRRRIAIETIVNIVHAHTLTHSSAVSG